MKVLIVIILIIVGVYVFRQEIVDKIESDVKKIPPSVEQYNKVRFGINYFIRDQRAALELKGICTQNSIWLNDKITNIFAQNCADANDSLK
ncbi:MAG: hypothetical protein LBS26_05830 [Campylobacteraceae bacterium]|jgi:hypothetical protein|nr:hypothetical protein [Campylobacteraceae bacterium]